MNNIKRVCVFASSCNYLDKSYYKTAAEFGKLLAKSGFDMVYGGSSLGLMWACAEQVKLNGKQIIGVMPEKLYNMGVFTDSCVNLTVTPCMRSRKAKMDELSDAVVALAGGFGTLEELSEMIVQKQLGYNNKPIIILNTNGFYDKLAPEFGQPTGWLNKLLEIRNNAIQKKEEAKRLAKEQKKLKKVNMKIAKEV